MPRLGKCGRFEIHTDGLRRSANTGFDHDVATEVSGSTDRFQFIKIGQRCIIDFVEFACNLMANSRLVKHHRSEPIARNDEGIALCRPILAEVRCLQEDRRVERETFFQSAKHK